jgi:hypothetical protein
MLAILLVAGPGLAADFILIDNFDGDLSRWQHEVFQHKNDYQVVTEENGNRALRAYSRKSASALLHPVKFNPFDYPRLRWRWRIAGTINGGNARVKEKDDYAARLYVIFPHWIKPLSRTINYIWANQLKVGDVVPSTYFGRSVMLAIESGNKRAGDWVDEERNLVDDYRNFFGEDPPAVGGIAIMTDTDNTGEEAVAWYDDLNLQKSN